MLNFGDIVQDGIVQCCDLVFLRSPATATMNCIQSKTENYCVIFGVILTLGKQTPNSYLPEEIMPVVKRVQEQYAIFGMRFLSLWQEKGRYLRG